MTTRTDDDFARGLRDLVDAVEPTVHVHLARVIPGARRRRTRHRLTAGAATLGVVALAGGWTAQARPWDGAPSALPAGAASVSLTPSPVPSAAAPVPSPTPDAAAAGWPDASFWRVVSTEYTATTGGNATTEHREGWFGRTDPGLIVVDGNLDPGHLIAFGPALWGHLDIAGKETIIGWTQLAALPTNPTELHALLAANVKPDVSVGTPDDKVFQMASDLLAGSPAPIAVRDALWQLLTTLPGSRVTAAAQDSMGRPGAAVERTVETSEYRLVYDASAHRLLEREGGFAGASGDLGSGAPAATRTTYLEEGPAGAPPVTPTLAMAGCTSWATC